MEAVRLPFNKTELNNPEVQATKLFLKNLENEAYKSEVFDHPFLIRLSKGVYSERAVHFAFIQFSKHVKIFTSCLGFIIGTAPDIRDRLVLFGNLSEEMGNGSLLNTHYMLYLKLLASMGISQDEIDDTRTIPAIDILNDGLLQAVKYDYVNGLAWLGLGGELTIPNNFPYLAQGLRKAYANLEMGFFERHGGLDQEHSDDCQTLLALQVESPSQRERVRKEVMKSLYLRSAVWEDLGRHCANM